MIPEEAVEAAAVAWTRLMCGCYDPDDVRHMNDELRKILEAASTHMLESAYTDGYCDGMSGDQHKLDKYRAAK